MSLLNVFLSILQKWETSFPKQPSYQRAVLISIASLSVIGRGCISRIISFLGLDQKDWSAHYKLFSRCKWDSLTLFDAVVQTAIPLINEKYIAIAFDDTKLKKTGKKIKTAFYQRDPMSPPFHVNLIYGLRFLQASILIPLYLKNDSPPRALPISFKEVPAVKKPGKKATDQEKQQYKLDKKSQNLSIHFIHSLEETRRALDQAGAFDKTLIATVDGSFCNKICMNADVDRACIVARARKDAKICHKASGHSKRFYEEKKFTPEQVRQDETIPWQECQTYHGGKWRTVRFKEVNNVLWQRGTKKKFLKLIVIAPTPYRLTKNGRLYYRDAAYLLCTKTEIFADVLVQKYFDRWQIEVNHREEKDTLGVGQAQVRSEKSVSRQPGFVVASYSALLLAGIICFEDKRNEAFMPLPKWRKKSKRPSCLDLVQLLRKEAQEYKSSFGHKISLEYAVLNSAA